MVVTSDARSACGLLTSLPLELQLRVLEELGGPDLCAVEASCHDLRRLVTANDYLYRRSLAEDFGISSAVLPPAPTSWKAQYVQAFIQVRLDTLEQQKRVYTALKMRLEELDELLGQADDVKALLGAPEFLLNEPSMVLTIVGDMEQDVLQQRWDASEDLLEAESKMLELQAEVHALLDRVPCVWRGSSSLQVAAGRCTIA